MENKAFNFSRTNNQQNLQLYERLGTRILQESDIPEKTKAVVEETIIFLFFMSLYIPHRKETPK
jgi:hypothetical protein